MLFFEMFDGPASQKVFASIWLLALLGCIVGEIVVIYLASGHHL